MYVCVCIMYTTVYEKGLKWIIMKENILDVEGNSNYYIINNNINYVILFGKVKLNVFQF